MFWTMSERLAPICLMALVLVLSRLMAQRGHRQRLRTEAQRLRRALHVGLQGLRHLYEGNLGMLESGERRLISGRNQIGLFRSQMGRLVCLEEVEVDAVMMACIAAELAESAMAVAGRSVAGATFVLLGPLKQKEALVAALSQACSSIRSAEDVLLPAPEASIPPDGQASTILTPTTTSITEIPERTTFSGA
jgi:hypothetical protein